MPTKTKSLHTQLVEISEEFLGPAGERFINRQIETHLDIKPEKIRNNQIQQLVGWTSVAFALLTNNRQERQEFKASLQKLASSGSTKNK